MDGVTELINEHPELRYQRTLTIGEELELDEFAVLLDNESESPSENMTDEEYEAYIAKIEEEAEAMQEKLESDPESIYDVDNTEVGYIYLYIDSNSGEIKYINVAYGENSKAQTVLNSNPEEKILPTDAEYAQALMLHKPLNFPLALYKRRKRPLQNR